MPQNCNIKCLCGQEIVFQYRQESPFETIPSYDLFTCSNPECPMSGQSLPCSDWLTLTPDQYAGYQNARNERDRLNEKYGFADSSSEDSPHD